MYDDPYYWDDNFGWDEEQPTGWFDARGMWHADDSIIGAGGSVFGGGDNGFSDPQFDMNEDDFYDDSSNGGFWGGLGDAFNSAFGAIGGAANTALNTAAQGAATRLVAGGNKAATRIQGNSGESTNAQIAADQTKMLMVGLAIVVIVLVYFRRK